MLEAGDSLPDLKLTDADGVQFPLSRYEGAPLIVYFYPKADTPGCTTEAKDFSALMDEFAKAGTTILAVSRDKPAKLAKFRDKYDLKVLLISDEDGAVCAAFGTWVEKSMYGRTYMGIARSTFLVGADGRIARAWPKVKVKGHAAEVLEAVSDLG